jgi:hypothetical protein
LKNAHISRETRDFSVPRKRDFARLNLQQLDIFEQPVKDFLSEWEWEGWV